jgi:hypothetical protein
MPRRGQTIEALRPESGTVLDTRNVTAFSGGQCWVWQVSGRFRVTRTTASMPSSAQYFSTRRYGLAHQRFAAPRRQRAAAASCAHRLSGVGFEEAPTFNAPPPIQHQFHRFGIRTMLLCEDSLRERFR